MSRAPSGAVALSVGAVPSELEEFVMVSSVTVAPGLTRAFDGAKSTRS
jgi:hypothetical protein